MGVSDQSPPTPRSASAPDTGTLRHPAAPDHPARPDTPDARAQTAPDDALQAKARGTLADVPEVPAEPALVPVVAPTADGTVIHKFRARNVSLTVLTVLAVLFAMKSAHDFIVPLVLAAIIAYALDPIVAALERVHVPRALGTVLIMSGIVAALIYGALALEDQVMSIINSLPDISRQVARSLSGFSSDNGSVLDKLRSAAAVFQSDGPRSARAPQQNEISVDALLLAGSMSVATFLAQATVVTFLVFFLLVAGNTFKRKFVKVAGQTLTQKKISVHMLDEINRSIQSYLLMMLVTNVALGVMTYIAFKWIGLANAGIWALVAGCLHIIPYFGPLIVAIVTGVAAIVQFGELGPAILVVAASVIIAVFVGIVMTTWMSGRIARMNAVAVFIVLLLFTWLWGIWGTLLSIPLAFIAKVISDHVEGLESVAEFLGE